MARLLPTHPPMLTFIVGWIRRLLALVLVLFVGFALIVGCSYTRALYPAPRHDVILGLTFSPKYARELGLDPRASYAEMIKELHPHTIRLPLYWDEIETAPGQYNLSDVLWYVNTAAAAGVHLIPSLGYKQPRWPECYEPSFVLPMSAADKRTRILDLLRVEVTTLESTTAIDMWQVENEPFVNFGKCGREAVLNYAFVQQEVDLVKHLDSRPILITDAGEWGLWVDSIQLSDVFGTTLYRDIWYPDFGVLTYPLAPEYYTIKDRVVRSIFHKEGTTIVAEVQAEAWFMGGLSITAIDPAYQHEQFPEQTLSDHVDFARRTDFPEILLWGTEWWYWMKAQGYPQYVEAARQIFDTSAP
ncbi:MAG: hypothetical protein IT305_04900 [Chloroflexi bacterium]|nr:hypothetical protein [Chloroflexota bacterium]